MSALPPIATLVAYFHEDHGLLRVCNRRPNLCKKQSRTVALDRAGLPFRVLSAQEDHLGAGLPSGGPIPMAAPFYLGTDRASPGIMLHAVPVFLSAE
jgi:hypothetical protein